MTMSTSSKSLGIDRLSVADRLRLVQEIWDSIADSVDSMDIPQSHKDELDRRLSAMKDDPHAGSTWEEVKARLQGKAEETS